MAAAWFIFNPVCSSSRAMEGRNQDEERPGCSHWQPGPAAPPEAEDQDWTRQLVQNEDPVPRGYLEAGQCPPGCVGFRLPRCLAVSIGTLQWKELPPVAGRREDAEPDRQPPPADEQADAREAPRRYRCRDCSASFSRASNRTRHRLSVHLHARFPCPVCGRVYTRPDTLQQHRRNVQCAPLKED